MSGINLPTGYPEQWNPATFSAWSYCRVFCCVSLPPVKQVSDVKIYRNVTKERPLMKEHPYANEHPYMKECSAPNFCLALRSKFTVISAHAPVLLRWCRYYIPGEYITVV